MLVTLSVGYQEMIPWLLFKKEPEERTLKREQTLVLKDKLTSVLYNKLFITIFIRYLRSHGDVEVYPT